MPPLFKSGNSRFRMNLPTSLLVYYLLGGEEWAQFLESVGKWPHLEKCRGMRHIEHRKALERYQLFAFSLIQMSIVHWQFHSKPNKKTYCQKHSNISLYTWFLLFFCCFLVWLFIFSTGFVYHCVIILPWFIINFSVAAPIFCCVYVFFCCFVFLAVFCSFSKHLICCNICAGCVCIRHCVK